MPKEQWEIELESLLSDHNLDTSELIALKNFIQKEKIMAKVRENNQWIAYFRSKDINKPELVKHFQGMNMKYSGILSRF